MAPTRISDDAPDLRAGLRQLLHDEGDTVCAAGDGVSGRDVLTASSVPLVVR
jgi:hypothetical protein